jgi:hypothetical protein
MNMSELTTASMITYSLSGAFWLQSCPSEQIKACLELQYSHRTVELVSTVHINDVSPFKQLVTFEQFITGGEGTHGRSVVCVEGQLLHCHWSTLFVARGSSCVSWPPTQQPSVVPLVQIDCRYWYSSLVSSDARCPPFATHVLSESFQSFVLVIRERHTFSLYPSCHPAGQVPHSETETE